MNHLGITNLIQLAHYLSSLMAAQLQALFAALNKKKIDVKRLCQIVAITSDLILSYDHSYE